MSHAPFAYSRATLEGLAAQVLDLARAAGASAAETEISEGSGLSVAVRHGEIETIEHNRDKGIGVTVYLGQRRGHASSSDFSADALARTVDKAVSIARYTAEDDCAGLAEAELGWRPSLTFEEGLADTVRWYLDNEAWWRPIRDKRYSGQRLGGVAA